MRGVGGLEAYFARYLPQLVLAVVVPLIVGSDLPDELAALIGRCVALPNTLVVVSTDLSRGMLDVGAEIDRRRGIPLAMAQCDAALLPVADESFDHVFTSYGAVPFVADSAAVMTEAHRVLRPGGTFVFSTTPPIRWAFPDVPGEDGLTAHGSYFDRTPYVEGFDDGSVTYAEHHRTLGDRVREITAAGLALVDLVEPEWPERNLQEWGGWSPTRGRVLPGTAIFVCVRPAR